MDKKLNDLINKSSIPEQLLTYFKESNRAKEYINESMLEDIEELFIFYKALFHFDETEFSAFTISTLKRGSEATAYYYYLKKVLDSNLELISKDKKFIQSTNMNSSNEIFMKTALEFGQNVDYFYKDQIDKIDIPKTYELLGMLDLINKIEYNETYIRMYASGKSVIERKLEEFKKHGISINQLKK